jgi:4-hydroxy-tetrahydrodipicolinate reductase
MGATVCQAVHDDPDLRLVAAVDPFHSGLDLRQVTRHPDLDLDIGGDVETFVAARADVVVDFTNADVARETLPIVAQKGIHAVVGTSGLNADDYADLGRCFTRSNCIVAPNFAIGAVLMMRFAEMAAPFFESAEVIELHHERKIDAPSGTAMMTVERMAASSDRWAPDPTERVVIDGARGGRGPGEIPVHSVRLRGLVAHQEVLLGTTGQSLTIRHDSYDRSSFLPGVLLAVKAVPERPGLTVGLDALLQL